MFTGETVASFCLSLPFPLSPQTGDAKSPSVVPVSVRGGAQSCTLSRAPAGPPLETILCLPGLALAVPAPAHLPSFEAGSLLPLLL